jgi:ABC-2 type transport system ATP-binding protein
MIEVQHLTKRYGRTVAIEDISFSVSPGEIVGFLGPNGAGKTTTMRILAGYMPATSGIVRIGNLDVFANSLAVRERIGYMPEMAPLYDDMRVTEYLHFRGKLKGLGGRRLRRRIDECMGHCGLESARRKVIRRLSKGFRQRVALADTLLAEPEVLILDEPTIGLDPNQIREIRKLIRGFAERHTVLLCSHILHEVEMICDRVLIIHEGRIVASDTTRNLVSLTKGAPRIVLEIQGADDGIEQRLGAIDGVLKVIREPVGDWQRFTCECKPDSDVGPRLFALASSETWQVREMRTERPNLEDVFVKITTGHE